ncbi:hypothetical protein D6779_00825 [Candidatus Parcubacteria bacterium]|nr:MAG: hypothetical protein D6779_00825 [Candidatus Parcubacteria bacterium]
MVNDAALEQDVWGDWDWDPDALLEQEVQERIEEAAEDEDVIDTVSEEALLKEIFNESGHKGLATDDWDWDPSAIDDSLDEGLDPQSAGGIVETLGGDDCPDREHTGLDVQENHPHAQNLSGESILKSLHAVPEARQKKGENRRLRRLQKLAIVTEEDFSDPLERKLVRVMRLRAEAILQKTDMAIPYLKWFMLKEYKEDPLNFEQCCAVLKARPNVVRLKLHTYLFLKWVVINDTLGVFCAPPPIDVLDQAIFHAGNLGEEIVRFAWAWPSVSRRTLFHAFGTEDAKKVENTLEILLEKRLMLENGTNLYVVGHYGRQLERKQRWEV